jgi:hypothetical protein
MTFSVQDHPTCLDHESCVIRKAKVATHSHEMSANRSWKIQRHNLRFQSAVCPQLIETVVGTDQREDLHPFDGCALGNAAQLLTSPTPIEAYLPLLRAVLNESIRNSALINYRAPQARTYDFCCIPANRGHLVDNRLKRPQNASTTEILPTLAFGRIGSNQKFGLWTTPSSSSHAHYCPGAN